LGGRTAQTLMCYDEATQKETFILVLDELGDRYQKGKRAEKGQSGATETRLPVSVDRRRCPMSHKTPGIYQATARWDDPKALAALLAPPGVVRRALWNGGRRFAGPILVDME
jgi:hypothetical protein